MTPRPLASAGRPGLPRRIARLLQYGAALLLAAALWQPARADCPPPPAPPTADEMAALQRGARDRGLLWRLDKDGRTGWLFGSLHLGRREWIYPGPRLLQALQAADTVALELDFSDAAAIELGLAEAMATMRQRESQGPLPAPLAERLARQRGALCAEPTASQPAMMQALSLSMLVGRVDGLEPAYAQEYVLTGFARGAGKRVVGLETVATQLEALTPATPAALAGIVDSTLTQIETGALRRQVQTLVEAWAAGDLDKLADYESWCGCVLEEQDRQLMRRLNDGRNPALAERIDALLAEGRRPFVAVGALHMTGAQALPALLARRGWTLTRLLPP